MSTAELGAYEARALAEVDTYKNPELGFFSKVVDAAGKPAEALTEAAFDTRAGSAISKAISKGVDLVNEGASWTVREKAIFEEFRKDGYPSVNSFADIAALDLASIDKTVGYLAAKYKGLAAVEGGAAGLTGAAGIAVDIPALIGLALRACNEYAAYYGFDPSMQAEQVFVMHLLGVASAPSQAGKRAALTELTKISMMIGERESWEALDRVLSARIIQRMAEIIGIRMAKGKAAQVVPLFGAVVGAGYNAWYLAQVTEAASLLYRERYLIERYGSEVAVLVQP